MKLSEQLRFCWKDLFAPQARGVTWSLVATLVILVAVLFISFALTFGQQQISETKRKGDPLSSCLLIGNENHTAISPEQLVKIANDVEANISIPDSFSGLFGFRVLLDKFAFKDSLGAKDAQDASDTWLKDARGCWILRANI